MRSMTETKDAGPFTVAEWLPVVARMMTVLHKIRAPGGEKPAPEMLAVVGHVGAAALARVLAEDAPGSVVAIIDPLVEELARLVRSELMAGGTRN
jgi:hypothetical protein